MNKAYLLDVIYKTKDGMRDSFLEEIQKIKMEELSCKEPGNILYKYSVNETENNNVYLREIWVNPEEQAIHTKTEHFMMLSKLKNKYVDETIISNHEVYVPKLVNKPVCGEVVVPGSKSMTNRALLLAAFSKNSSLLRGVLFSDDSRHFLNCLEELGFELVINEKEKTVKIKGCGGSIPEKNAIINVGSAGTAARFLTAMLALSDGEYTIECSEQMKKRPMQELFKILTEMGAKFTYIEKDGFLPVKVKGNCGACKDINMDISKSTQFLSAMLMVTPITKSGICINITSEKKDGAYIRITREMLKEFGVNVEFDGNVYKVEGNQNININDYYIEPDVSAACYFYAIAAVTGGSITVKNVFFNSKQGDMKFIDVLKKMGCKVVETKSGINVSGRKNGELDGITVDMNDFSDQALTLAAIAPFANSEGKITNVLHIRGQECDRIKAIVDNLKKCKIKCVQTDGDITIYPGKLKGALIETYEDHRVAMSFTIMGLRTNGIIIDNPMCCRKTFENYYEVLESLE